MRETQQKGIQIHLIDNQMYVDFYLYKDLSIDSDF